LTDFMRLSRRAGRLEGMKAWTVWKESGAGYRTGVSLHSHTSHSRETLEFLPRLAAGLPPLRWRPPLGPREALAVERGQIEKLGLRALVSITDHDNIEAPMLLRVLSESRDTPVSVEWTVPFRETFFHLGLHQMGPRRASEKMAALQRFTDAPREAELGGLLEWLTEEPETLIVFNHPLWDEKGLGQTRHERMTLEFVGAFRPWIHGLELNGLRSRGENRRVMALGERESLPAVAGGDRHGWEPNALINVTRARTFGEFVEEVREDGMSCVAAMPQYDVPRAARIAALVAEVLRARWAAVEPAAGSAATIRGSCVRDSSY